METHDDALLRVAFVIGRGVLIVGFAQEGERGPVGAGTWFDDVGNEAVARGIVEIREILATAAMLGLAIGRLLDGEFISLANEFAFHVAAEIEVAAMRDAFQFPVFPLVQEGEGVFDVSGADAVVAQVVGGVVAQNEIVAFDAKIEIPLIPPVAPVGVPLPAFRGMTEELDFHLLEFARTEGEVARRDLVADTLSDLADAKGNADATAVDPAFLRPSRP